MVPMLHVSLIVDTFKDADRPANPVTSTHYLHQVTITAATVEIVPHMYIASPWILLAFCQQPIYMDEMCKKVHFSHC